MKRLLLSCAAIALLLASCEKPSENLSRQDDYVKTWDQFEFLPGVPEALNRFHQVVDGLFLLL